MSGIKARFIRFGVGTDDVNARLIPANFTPTSYVPAQVGTEGNDKISAHLKGIDAYLGGITPENEVWVKLNPGPGEFSSIKDAIDSITTASITNPFKVRVGPGTFVEDPFTMKTFVFVEGANDGATVLETTTPGSVLVNAVGNSAIRGIRFNAANDPGIPVVQMVAAAAFTDPFILSECEFYAGDFFVELLGTNLRGAILVDKVRVDGDFDYTQAFRVARQSGSGYTELFLANILSVKNGGAPTTYVSAEGDVSLLMNSVVHRVSTGTGIGIYASDGAKISLINTTLDGFDTAILIANVGSAPTLRVAGGVAANSGTWDLLVQHPGTTGVYNGSAESSKISIDPSANITLSTFSPTGDGIAITGPIYSGSTSGTLVDIRALVENGPTLGLFDGGTLSDGGGFVVNVAAGYGYWQSGALLMKKAWTATSITLSAVQDLYIYFNSSGILTASASFPATDSNILLGRVVTNLTGIGVIDLQPMFAKHHGNSLDRALRFGFGPIYDAGSIVSENVTPLKLDITAGDYYFSANRLLPAGGTAITFTPVYRDGSGGYIFGSPTDTVDNANWDNNSGAVVPLTSGYFTKHTLWIAGAGTALQRFFMVYGQAEYSAQAAAVTGFDPAAPSSFKDGVVQVAGIIVEEGDPNVDSIIDTRPTLSFRSGSLASVSDHGNLSGLADDDHPQYLLVSGARAMSGNLDLGGNSIVNVNLVDGVDVAAHASRHLPNGADPLTSAIAFMVRPDNVAAIGVANSFSRSDHLHALPSAAPAASIAPDLASAVGTANSVSRSDHVHNVPTAAAIGVLPNNANGQGVSTSFARADHSHALPNAAAITITPDQANAAGTNNSVARSDHVHQVVTAAAITLTPDAGNTQGASTSFSRADHGHNIATAAAIGVLPNNANGAGTSSSFARADHSHALPNAAPITQTPDQANAAGTANTVARSDHTHLIATAVAVNIGIANAQGASTSFARADHVHQGIHSLKANTGGTARFGDIVLQQGTGLTITDDGLGTFTFETIDGANEFSPSIGLLLNVAVTGGDIVYNGTRYVIASGNVGVNPNVTNGTIYIDVDGAIKATAGAGNAPDDTYPIALFTSSLTNVTVVTDIRTYLNKNEIWGQTANISTILPNAAADGGTSNRHARADHTHAIAVAAAVTLTPDAGNSAGASTSFSRADHVHNIPTAAAVSLTANSTNTQGAAATFARSDHTHAQATAAGITLTPDLANATGTSTSFSRADHVHNVPTATAVGLDSTSTSTQGAAAAFARADHTHAIASGVVSTQTPDQANAAGTSANFAKADHVHQIPTASAVGLTANSTSTQGAAASFARADHTHAISSGVVSSQAPDQANAAGASANFARADHIHTIPTAAAVGLTATTGNTQGAASTFARSDHTHAISTGAPATQTPDQANATGTGTDIARADHIHLIATAAGITLTPNAGNSIGVSTSFSRADHGHNVPTAAPTTSLSATTANADGAAGTFARSDHTHALLTGAASTQTPDQSNTTGSSANLARADHGHNIPTATAVGLDAASTSTQGAAASFARSNHTHAIASGAPSTQTPDQANATGTSTNFARADHIHLIATAAAVQLVPDAANAQGVSTSFSRADHVHNVPTATAVSLDANSTSTQGAAATFARSNHTHAIASGVVSTQNPDQANAAGTSANFARADHIHNIPAAIAVTASSNANAKGVSTSFALADHTHQHTAGTALLDHVGQYDGSNWQAIYPENLLQLSHATGFKDDWLSGVVQGQGGWLSTIVGGGSLNSLDTTKLDGNHVGIVNLTSGAAAARYASLTMLGMNVLGGGIITIECLFQISTTTNALYRIGLGDLTTNVDYANGVYLEYNSATSANWLMKTAAGGSRTSTTTTTAATTATWHKLVITINAAASSVSFTMDGVSLGTAITATIPTLAVGPVILADSLAATTSSLFIDYYQLTQRFTTAR